MGRGYDFSEHIHPVLQVIVNATNVVIIGTQHATLLLLLLFYIVLIVLQLCNDELLLARVPELACSRQVTDSGGLYHRESGLAIAGLEPVTTGAKVRHDTVSITLCRLRLVFIFYVE